MKRAHRDSPATAEQAPEDECDVDHPSVGTGAPRELATIADLDELGVVVTDKDGAPQQALGTIGRAGSDALRIFHHGEEDRAYPFFAGNGPNVFGFTAVVVLPFARG